MPQSTPEARRTYYKKWYAMNRDRWRAHVKQYLDSLPPEEKRRRAARSRELYGLRHKIRKFARLYNMPEFEIARLLAIGVCEICGRGGDMVFDHNHATGTFRGRLCTQCNTGVGMFGDNPDTLESAAQYLRDRQEKKS